MAKPAFDPNKPFEVVEDVTPKATAKPAFDPNAPFEPVATTPVPSQAGNTVMDALAGTAQGSLMGGADETGGGLQALLDLGQRGLNKIGLAGPSPTQVNADLKAQGFKGDIGPTTTSEIYREGQRETDRDMKAAEERSPYAFTTGQLAGAVGSGMGAAKVIGAGASALGATKTAGQVGGALGKYSPEVLKDMAAYLNGTGKIPKALVGAGKMAALAAPEGALAGALMSEKDLIGEDADVSGVMDDAASGALTGSVLGAGGSLAMDLVPAAAKWAGGKLANKVDDFTDNTVVGTAYREGRDLGKSYNDRTQQLHGEPGSFGPLNTQENVAAEKSLDRIMKADKELGAAVGNSLDEATNAGVRIVVSDELGNSARAVQQFAQQNPELFDEPKIINTINKIFPGSSNLTPTEARGALAEIEKLEGYLKRDPSPQIAKLGETAQQVRAALSNELKKQVPQYRNASQRFAEFRDAFADKIELGNTSNKYGDAFGSMADRAPKLQKNLRKIITDSARPGGSQEAGSTLADLITNTKSLEASEAKRIADGVVKPGEDVFSKMGLGKPSQFADEIQKEALKSSAMRQSQAVALDETGGAAAVKGLSGLALAGRAKLTTGANFAGRAVRQTKALGKAIYGYGPEQLGALSQDLMNRPGGRKMGEALNNAVQSNDTAKKNAILFSILQNPDLRIQLGEATDLSESPDSSDSQ